jgi:surface carbohydrate biosynthesis protein
VARPPRGSRRVKGVRIVLLVSSKIRDLAGLVYLKVLLEGRGASVTLVNTLTWQSALAHRPHLVMIPSIWNPQGIGNMVDTLKRRGILLGFLPTEGVLRCDEEVSLIYGDDIKAVQQVDVTCVWGQELRRILEEYYKLPSETLELCGSLRFDLYRPPLSRMYFTDRPSFCERLGLNPDWPIITWATGYPGAERFREREHDGLDEKNFKGLQIPGFTGLQFARMQLAAQDATFAAMTSLVRAIPHANFVIKVRPDETTKLYDEFRARATGGGRVAVVKAEPVFTLVQASDIWLHWNSTTSTEAWFYGLPTINLFLGGAREYCLEQMSGGSMSAYTVDDLYDFVRQALKDPTIPPALTASRTEFIEKWFHRIDGQSGVRHVVAIERLLGRVGRLQTPPFDGAVFRTRALGTVKRALGRESYDSLRFWSPSPWDSSALASEADMRVQENAIRRTLAAAT